MGMPAKDETGNRYGLLWVLRREGSTCSGKQKQKSAKWRCLCDCGNETVVIGALLRSGSTRSCGCLRRGAHSPKTTHGASSTREYRVLKSAETRARNAGIPFDLDLKFVEAIPDRCPVLGIRMETGRSSMSPATPTLDRMVPNLGYTKANTRYISGRANRLKQDATADETLAISAYQMGCPDHLMGWADFEQELG